MKERDRPGAFPSARQDEQAARHIRETPQTRSPSYRLAFADPDFLLRDDLRPVRLQLELLKPELALQEADIVSTIVVFGSARTPPPEDPSANPERIRDYEEARRFARLMSEREPADGLRSVIVTGGGKGIGGIYCRRLAEAGAKVVAADIDGDANDDTVAAIRANGGEAVAANTDVSDAEDTAKMAAVAIEAFGRIDGLVNNASLMSVLPRGSWLDIDVERWDRVMEVNLRGIFLCCKAVFPHMESQGGGKIVNSEGQTDREAWGKQAPWVDYHGPVDGETVGIAIMNHPSSFRYPTYWHVRTYGLFAANPFGLHNFVSRDKDGSHTLQPGESMTLRYRVLLHKGDTEQAQIAEAFKKYAAVEK